MNGGWNQHSSALFIQPVYDVTKRATFNSLPSWMNEIAENCTVRDPVVLLCGVKLDEESKREVPDTEAMLFAAKHKLLHCETSAKTGQNVEFCFFQLGAKVSDQASNNPAGKMTGDIVRETFATQFC